MSVIVTMPQMGLTEESAVISKWYASAGDAVKSGDLLFAVEIGKATFDVPAEAEGSVLELFAAEGDEVAVKAPVCVIGSPGESYERPACAAAPTEEKKAPEPTCPPSPAVLSAKAAVEVFVSPRARAAAARRGIDPALAVPTGAEGRVMERDLDSAAARRAEDAQAMPASAHEAEAEYIVRPNSGIRKVIAKNMHDSLASMAQLSMTAYFDATAILALRAEIKAEGEKRGLANISLNDMVLYAVSRALADHPELNAHYSEQEMRLYRHVNLGVAVDTERGLMVPTVFHADELTLNELSLEAKALAAACRQGTIKPQQLSGGTITVSNLGNTGISSFTPVINPPQTALVGVCGLEWKVRPGKDGAPELYRAMGLSLTIDHRAVDGAPGAKFLSDLCGRLESFDLLLIK